MANKVRTHFRLRKCYSVDYECNHTGESVLRCTFVDGRVFRVQWYSPD